MSICRLSLLLIFFLSTEVWAVCIKDVEEADIACAKKQIEEILSRTPYKGAAVTVSSSPLKKTYGFTALVGNEVFTGDVDSAYRTIGNFNPRTGQTEAEICCWPR